jgi:hypothetical protein
VASATGTDRARAAVAAALARRPLPPRSPAWLEESIVQRTAQRAREVSDVDDEAGATKFAAELIVFASTKRPEGKRRRERRDQAALLAERALFEHTDGHRLNFRERELVRHLATLAALRHLREYPRGLHGAEAKARRVVDVALGIVIPAHSDQPAR